jgi:hypothetical protein
MSQINLSMIPRDVVLEAIRIVKDQGSTPMSPGQKRSDGTTALCAAAALADAGLKAADKSDRSFIFRAAIGVDGSKEPIRQVFLELGWPVETCDEAVIVNDGFPDYMRTDSVVQCFEGAI